jgi:hypothetical protein
VPRLDRSRFHTLRHLARNPAIDEALQRPQVRGVVGRDEADGVADGLGPARPAPTSLSVQFRAEQPVKPSARLASVALFLIMAALPLLADRPSQPGPRVQELIPPATFRKAGLDRLSPGELQELNAWLAEYTRLVMGLASPSAVTDTRKGEIIESHINGSFTGWSGETVFKLDNGQFWQQASYAYMYHYAYHPSVSIYPKDTGYQMKVEDVDETLPVRRLTGVIESSIDGEFLGWDGDTVFKLLNGQIWQQASASALAHASVNPKVLVYRGSGGYKMQVEGVSQTIIVRRLR